MLAQHRLHPYLFAVMAAIAFARITHAAPQAFPASQQEYWAQFDQRDWTAAIAAAEQLVNVARASADPDPVALSEMLTLLGNAQLGGKNLVGAEAAYAEALQLIEPRVGPTSEKLLDPVRGLAYTLAAGGKHELAIPLLQKALVISRRNSGLFDPGQQGLLRQLASSLTAVDAAVDAEKHILYLLRIGERSYGARDLRMVPLLCVVGDWYTQIGVMAPARESYRAALDIAQSSAGKDSLAVIDPLRSLAASYRRELFLSGAGLLRQPDTDSTTSDAMTRDNRPITAQLLNIEGERALLRAVNVLQGHAGDAPSANVEQLTLDTLVDAGDWYQIRNQPQKARDFYHRAAALVPPSSADSRSAATAPFAFPVQVYLPMPLLATRHRFRPADDVEERFVQVEFTVTSDGAVTSERVVEHDGSSRQINETLDAIRMARYRPKFVDGAPVETSAVSYRQLFRQRKDKDAAPDKAS